jgi:ATP-dependent Clp protease ATP-binding subunit ClpC
LQKVRDEGAADLPDPVLDRLIDLGDYYLAGMAQPGRSVGLLRRVLSATAGKTGPIGERDILTTMSTSTGIPVDFLDDAVPMDRAQIKAFFEARVMGQTEAVDTVVDLVTLIKAGLTDPNKPFGVLLFVGPTGVGKTELARSLAELLFGDPGRMIRIDMSEFATWDAYERLIGRGTMPGLLTSPVREKPFSVVLLDEIEKANMNVFDLCLQVFDAGRLTDSQGRVADFRRTIIIITSNIGSASARPAPVGFGRKAQPVLDREALMKELSRFFRPEFLNRIDRIVHFLPLAEETAVKIAQREVSRVLERGGIARRKLAIDVEPGVFPLLLREGYSITFGARPLKRTVERMVLLPVAQVIAAGRVPAGAMLRLVAAGNKVNVQVDAAETAEPAPRKRGKAQAVPLTDRITALVKQVEDMRKQAEPLASRKSELLTSSSRPNFWDDRVAAQGVYDEVYRIDGIFKLLDELETGVHDEAEAPKAKRLSERDLARLEDRVELLESHARHVGFLVGCRDVRELSDALVSLTLVASHGASLSGVEQLAKMYMGLAARRGLEAEVLDDRHGGTPMEDAITLQITGVGAYALLAGESGLHQLTRGKREGKDGRKRPVDRDVVRVEVFPLPADTTPLPAEEVRTETRTLGEVKGRLLPKPRYEVQLLHAPTMVSVRGWADGTKAEAIESLTPVLRARVEAARTSPPADETGRPPVVRRYVLGPSPLVRDVRTNRTTGRVEEVLAGGLELFLHPPT